MHLSDWWEGFVVGVALVGGLATLWATRPTQAERRAMTRWRDVPCQRTRRPVSHVRIVEPEPGNVVDARDRFFGGGAA